VVSYIVQRAVIETPLFVVVIMVADMASVTVMNSISDKAAITAQAVAATTTWHTSGPTTPILELSTTRQGLTSKR
jgi:hypothetical protein